MFQDGVEEAAYVTHKRCVLWRKIIVVWTAYVYYTKRFVGKVRRNVGLCCKNMRFAFQENTQIVTNIIHFQTDLDPTQQDSYIGTHAISIGS